jgi:hypothetical protein
MGPDVTMLTCRCEQLGGDLVQRLRPPIQVALDVKAAWAFDCLQLVEREVPMLNALNEVLRDDYIRDSVSGIGRWNKVMERAGLPHRLSVPHKAFNRKIGTLANTRVSPDGRVVSAVNDPNDYHGPGTGYRLSEARRDEIVAIDGPGRMGIFDLETGRLRLLTSEGYYLASFNGTQIAFLHPKSLGGVLVELCQAERPPSR